MPASKKKSPAETAIAKFAADVLSPVQQAVRAVETAAQARLNAIKNLDSAENAVLAAEDLKWLTREAYVDAMSDLDTALMGESESTDRLRIRAY